MSHNQVAEIQGLYGPFTLSERVIQKIWLRQDFASADMKTVAGKQLIVRDPGRWNFHEGPDFKEARLILDGIEVIGDVEVHFNLLDWRHHQHENDANYDTVLLHVVLYPEGSGRASQMKTSRGYVPELLYLMPLLEQDLESYALEDALLELEQCSELKWVAQFMEQPLEARVQVLLKRAERRWQQKLSYAGKRLEMLGWEAACHHYALEVLGYSRNRAPMLKLAANYPLRQMRTHSDAGHLFAEMSRNWKLNGLRPANHPQQRLAQYLEIIAKQPCWPDRLRDCLRQFPAVTTKSETAAFRRAAGLSTLQAAIGETVFSSVISERRLNTLIVDAVVPLAAAAGLIDGYGYWLNWFPGDVPAVLPRFIRQAGVTNHRSPHSNGWNQGALGLFLDQGA